jgi:hypothetical protein
MDDATRARLAATFLLILTGCARAPADAAKSTPRVTPSPAQETGRRLERICVGTGGPSVVVEVRDAMGNRAATGATLEIRDGTFRDSSKYSWDGLHLGAGERRPGIYDALITKPWYKSVRIHGIKAPGDTICHYATPSDIRSVTLEVLPGAPPVRQVRVFPPLQALGVPEWPEQMSVYVDAKPGVSQAVSWSSSDTRVVKVLPTGVIIPQCRRGPGTARVIARSVADPRIQGFGIVEVDPIRDTRGLEPREAREIADACQRRLGRTPAR